MWALLCLPRDWWCYLPQQNMLEIILLHLLKDLRPPKPVRNKGCKYRNTADLNGNMESRSLIHKSVTSFGICLERDVYFLINMLSSLLVKTKKWRPVSDGKFHWYESWNLLNCTLMCTVHISRASDQRGTQLISLWMENFDPTSHSSNQPVFCHIPPSPHTHTSAHTLLPNHLTDTVTGMC